MAVVAGLLSLVGFGWMTLYAAIWWDSFMWSFLFCFMHIMSLYWLDSQFEPYSKNGGAVFCCGLAIVFTFLGVFFFLVPGIGLDLFRIFFNIGVIGALGSILFSCVEKIFDKQLHLAVDAACDAVKQKLTLGEIQVAVLIAFFIGLTSFLSPTPHRRPSQMCGSDHELMTKQTEVQQKEMAEKIDKITNAGKKFTICMVFGTLIWKSGVLFWIIHAYFSDIIHFTQVFVLGAGCTIMGIWLRNFPEFGLTPFVVGNLCLVISTLSLKGLLEQLGKMFDNTRADSATLMIIGFVLTQLTVFWWDSFILASCFSILYILSMLWYCLSYVPFGRDGVKCILSRY